MLHLHFTNYSSSSLSTPRLFHSTLQLVNPHQSLPSPLHLHHPLQLLKFFLFNHLRTNNAIIIITNIAHQGLLTVGNHYLLPFIHFMTLITIGIHYLLPINNFIILLNFPLKRILGFSLNFLILLS